MDDLPKATLSPFNTGRSTFRLLFDFGVMLSCFSSSANKRVLDFGAGTGWISEFLARSGYEVYAIDVDRGMPTTIRSRALADRRLHPKSMMAVIGSGMDLPFPDGFFSHVCCFDTLHHMNDYPKTFREMSRVLEPGGRAIFIEPGARHSRSAETIAFIETYKKDDPTWIERDVVLEEIEQISRESGFSAMTILPTLIPGLKSYTVSQWKKFRRGDLPLEMEYMDFLRDFNYNDHLSFYCEKIPASGSVLSGKRIAVDLTPLLPGGENGGAKLMTLELIDALAALLPETSFVLLTAEVSHAELDWLDGQYPNIQRMCVLHNSLPVQPSEAAPVPEPTRKEKVVSHLKAFAGRTLPPVLRQRVAALPLLVVGWKNRTLEQLEIFIKRLFPLTLRTAIRRRLHIPDASSLQFEASAGPVSFLHQIGADLLFCPFTAPFYAEPQKPTISVIYDLQYRTYPQFFTHEEVIQREGNFRMAYQTASHLVTISKFVRETVIEAAQLSPERVIAVPISLLRTSRPIASQDPGDKLLEKVGLRRGEYLHYPANFWQHKNHAMLLTAFNMFRKANPDSNLKLLCTGAPGRGAEDFCESVRRMGLAAWVVYPGYVDPDEYDFLLKSAFAMIFPSLYEGFGIPLLEAMSAGVPVLCSRVTSLPEVGGDAVLYFDPRKPAEIVNTLTRLLEDPGLREHLIAKGRQRVLFFKGAERMAIQYSDVFAKALLSKSNGAAKQPVRGGLT